MVDLVPLTLKGPGGGGGGGGCNPPPPDVSRYIFVDFFSRCKILWLFSFKSFDTIFVQIGHTVPKLRNIMSSNVGSKFDNFLIFVYKTYGKLLFNFEL